MTRVPGARPSFDDDCNLADVAVSHPDVLGAVEAAYREHFETAPARASISFLGVEPIDVLRYTAGSWDHFLSLGMSRHGMTDPTAQVIDDATAPRAELLLTAFGRPENLWRQLAILAAAPAVQGEVYAVGHRIDLSEPWCSGSRCTGAIIAPGPLHPIRVSGISDVLVLQVLPATATELAWARVHGTDALVQLWRSAGVEHADLLRDPVLLP